MAGSTQSADEPICDINVTPLVDVCLVLVIIFMAVAPMALTSGIKVLESRAKAAVGKVSADDNVKVTLTSDGRVKINGREIASGSLALELVAALSASKDKMVMVSADENNKVGEVVEIMDVAKQSGALKVAIIKTEQAEG